jgi:hypothetical protein
LCPKAQREAKEMRKLIVENQKPTADDTDKSTDERGLNPEFDP